MKQQIINELQNSVVPLSTIDLTMKLNVTNHQQQQQLIADLEELKNSEIIFENKEQEFYMTKHNNLFIGKIQITQKGFGFVKLLNSEEEYYVNIENINNALNGDEVLCGLIKINNQRDEATVLKVIKRDTNLLVGTIVIDPQTKVKSLVIQNAKMQQYEVNILNKDQALENNIVVAKIESFDHNIFNVTIDRILGNLNDPGVDILAVIYEIGIKAQFDVETLAVIEKIPQTVQASDKVGRIDLTKELLVTIDGKDAKDFDDAICVTKLSNGNYRLLVAIADVSHYVTENSPIDEEAFTRGTSVYLADRVIPMLPTQLSNGICSLNEQVERLCMVADMEIDKHGLPVSHRIYQAFMKSTRRMNYDEVNDAYNDKNPDFIKTHPQIWTMLQDAKDLYQILWKFKEAAGVIDFEINEAKTIIGKNGEVTDIVLRTRDTAEKLIESFMIRANEVVAQTIHEMKLPFIYRVHEHPRARKMHQMTTILKLMGLKLNPKIVNITSKDLQLLLNSLKQLPTFQILSTLLLRSMEKAQYSNKCIGHFGLASQYYTHFTSPIRRYPDLIVHRLLRQYLVKKQINGKVIEKYQSITNWASEQSSNMELKALECERAVDQMKKAEYMMKFIGQKFTGIISSVTGFGLFVELPNTIEGLIRISDMKDDYYIFNEKAMVLFGERKRKQYGLGQRVKIIVKDANKIARTIDFQLEESKQENSKSNSVRNGGKVYQDSKFKNKNGNNKKTVANSNQIGKFDPRNKNGVKKWNRKK
ncbi:ribonuclease R [Spiroplasma endosymbiont of Virgichneumon dumeticola]|uniref:ribonuclease R n=1 Tax=Spiroplasma endosymbiont of Virgichneumon dumeticola TaxID=3139323 RepID=UPI0035C8998D